jgi:hypothetical protein
MTAEEFLSMIIIGENGELDPTGLQQDCLGMTALHILACSTVQCLGLYQVMIEKYPENLIVEDAWGDVPLLYAVWGDAPAEIVQLLINSCQSLYPYHEFNWNTMLITLGRGNASDGVIQSLLDIQHTLSPGYNIDWDRILGVLAERLARLARCSSATFCFLTRCSIATRVNVIGVKHFRDAMADDYTVYETDFNRQEWRTETLAKLEYYESEYRKLKETTSILELALWKIKVDDSIVDYGNVISVGNKNMQMEVSAFKLQCRINCGVDQVIENVSPYLLPDDYLRTHQYQRQW